MNTKNRAQWEFVLCLFIALYTAVAYILSTWIEGDEWFDIYPSLKANFQLCLTYVLMIFVYAVSKGILIKDIENTTRGFINLNTLRSILVFTCLGLMLGSFHSIKIMMPEVIPFRWDFYFADLDHAIHRQDPWKYFKFLDIYYYKLIFLYIPVWFSIQILLTLFICFSNTKIKIRYLYSYVSIWIICGNIVPLMFMAVGPIYFERLTEQPRFSELSQRIFDLADPQHVYSLLPDTLWNSFVTKSSFTGSGISAFPSVHVAISTLIFIVAWQHSKFAGLLGLLLLVATMVLSVHLGWHYAVDGYASIILVALIWWFWGRVTPPTSSQVKPEGDGAMTV